MHFQKCTTVAADVAGHAQGGETNQDKDIDNDQATHRRPETQTATQRPKDPKTKHTPQTFGSDVDNVSVVDLGHYGLLRVVTSRLRFKINRPVEGLNRIQVIQRLLDLGLVVDILHSA